MKRGRGTTGLSDDDEDLEESPSQRQRSDGADDDDDVTFQEEPESQFVKGAIVKVVLKNFMTYGGPVEIKPGPRLNLVLGPNGTGKSSFVCAICIGLGFPTKLLGRAKEITEYVKSGENEAEITISLSQGAGERPLQVCRKITKTGETEFRLNGKKASAKDVAKMMREMNVQMDNLCQFLPQDRVVAFAQLSPIQLLEETEKAVDDVGLFKEHVWLKETKSGIRASEQQLARDKDQLARYEELQAASQRDVERAETRNKLEEEKKLLERALPWLEAEEGRRRHDEAKETEKQWTAEVAKRKAEHEQASAPLKEIEAEMARVKAELDKSKAFNEKMEAANAKHTADFEKAEEDIKDCKSSISNEIRKEKKRQDVIKKNETNLAAAKKELAELEAPTEMLDPDELADMERKIRDRDMSLRSIRRQEQELGGVISAARGRAATADRSLHAISSVREKRLGTLLQALRGPKNFSPIADDIQRAVDFVAKATADGRFQRPVYGPIACEVQTKDAESANYLELAVGARYLRQFVVTCQADYDLISRECTSASVTKWAQNENDPIPDDISPELLHHLAAVGITARLDQTFDAPPVVKLVLCNWSKLHLQLVGTERAAQNIKAVIDAAEARGMRNLGAIWTKSASFSSNRSRYGDKALSTSMNQIKPAQFLGRTTDDSGRKAEAEQQKREALDAVADAEGELKMFAKQRGSEEAELADLQRRREAVTGAQMNFERRRRALEGTVKELAKRVELDAKHAGCAENVAKLEKRLEGLVAKLYQAALQATLGQAQSVRHTVEGHSPLTLAGKELKARKDAVSKDLQKQAQAVDEAKKELAKAKEKAETVRAYAKELIAKAKKVGVLTQEEKDQVDEIVRKATKEVAKGASAVAAAAAAAEEEEEEEQGECDAEAVRAAIEATQHEIAQIFCADPSVVQQFQERAKKIDELSKTVKANEASVNEILAGIDARKAVWLPKLKAVVSSIAEKFTDSFKIIGSVGTVELFEPEDGDFAKFEARILVRFRDGELLSQLTANRQSGGERSVSTMFYLICLQDMTRCPFRMVDEINQGMDKKNERLVFQEMVRTSSKPNTPQCFLITPKLLPQLDYGKYTTVHSIFNGPLVSDVARHWTPERLFGSSPQTPLQTAEVF